MAELKGIHMKAVLHSIKVDSEGEAKVTFTVSLQFLKEILCVGTLTQMALDVAIKPEEKKPKGF